MQVNRGRSSQKRDVFAQTPLAARDVQHIGAPSLGRDSMADRVPLAHWRGGRDWVAQEEDAEEGPRIRRGGKSW